MIGSESIDKTICENPRYCKKFIDRCITTEMMRVNGDIDTQFRFI